MLFERYGRGKGSVDGRVEKGTTKENGRSGYYYQTGCMQRTDGCYRALYSFAVNSLWPTDCACLTVPFGAFPSSGHQR